MQPYPPGAPALPTPGPRDLAHAPTPSVWAAVRFAFSGDVMTNLGLGALFILIPLAGPLVLEGWSGEIHRRLLRQHPQPIPRLSFNDFTHYLMRGLPTFVVQLIAGFPIGIVITFAYIIAVAIGVFVVQAGEDPVIAFAVGGGVMFLAILSVFLIIPVLNAARTRAELSEQFDVALDFKAVFRHAGLTFGAVLFRQWLFSFAAFGLVLVGMLACYVGIFPMAAALTLAGVHLRYQLYQVHLARGGAPVPLAEAVALPSERPPQYYGP